MMGKDQGKGTWKKPESWRELAAAGKAGAKAKVCGKSVFERKGRWYYTKRPLGSDNDDGCYLGNWLYWDVPGPSDMPDAKDQRIKEIEAERDMLRAALESFWICWAEDQTKSVVNLSTPVHSVRETNVLFAHALEQILRAVSHGQYEQQKVIRQLAEYQVKEAENG